MVNVNERNARKKAAPGAFTLEMSEKLLNTTKYGNITLIVQYDKIIQIDKTEKHRLKD